VSAHQVAMSLASFKFMGVLGIRSGNRVGVRQAVGEGRSPRPAGLIGIGLGAAFMLAAGAVFAKVRHDRNVAADATAAAAAPQTGAGLAETEPATVAPPLRTAATPVVSVSASAASAGSEELAAVTPPPPRTGDTPSPAPPPLRANLRPPAPPATPPPALRNKGGGRPTAAPQPAQPAAPTGGGIPSTRD